MEGDGNNKDTCKRVANKIRELQKNIPAHSSKRCIYRIKKLKRQIQKRAFTPVLVSIGPLHNRTNKKSTLLHTIQNLKLQYLVSFLNETRVELETYLQIVIKNEIKIRECYADPITHLSRVDFIEMIMTDCAFYIEFVKKGASKEVPDDPIWGNPSYKNEVFRDILLEENQLPFFIVKELHERGRPEIDIAQLHFDFLQKCYGIEVDKELVRKSHHLLDLFRSHYVVHRGPASTNQPDQDVSDRKLWTKQNPTATKLVEANIKFRVGESTSLLDVSFDAATGILTIPKLIVGNRVECLFQNLIAYEVCQYPFEPNFISFAVFMSGLIKTPEDVQVLVNAGIVENQLGSEENFSLMLNSLCKNVDLIENAYFYAHTTKQINEYYNKIQNHYIAALKHKYFREPWKIITLFTAFYALVLTTIQAVASVKQK